MENEIVNRVASSSLMTFDLETLYVPGERQVYDLKDHLYQGLILKEKDFREHVKIFNWASYAGKRVAITCTADAIVPTWAYMLVAVALKPHARQIFFGTLESLETFLFLDALKKIDWTQYQDAKVVVKGCSHVQVPEAAYVEAVNQLLPFASSIMFGEPCSTVPLYKRPRG